jgi:hypothetical protein
MTTNFFNLGIIAGNYLCRLRRDAGWTIPSVAGNIKKLLTDWA